MKLILLLAALCSCLFAETKPNIILIYSDDHGWADLGAQGSVKDLKTPNLDALAKDGIRFTRGYVSAPQCVPSRAGVLTGRYQQRFHLEDNSQGPLAHEELTIAERLQPAGYVSCQVGKWHLEAPPAKKGGKKIAGSFQPWTQGFAEYYTGAMNTFAASHDLQGKRLTEAPQMLSDKRFRCVWQADAAISFIDRHQDDPFFLYVAFFAPHVPLESPEPWFSQTPTDVPLQRRQALAMIAAMDDGVGRIRAKLKEAGIDQNTLIVFIGDNGAPLKQGAWDGSLNVPLIGEKGMLTDGGIRTPFVAAWPGKIKAGQVFDAPVINLDVAATALQAAGVPRVDTLDGVDLMPYMTGEKTGNPHDLLYWRWRSQAAVRSDRWKLILLGKTTRYLFDLDSPEGETKNRIAEFPEVAADLEKKLMAWNATLPEPGLPRALVDADQGFFDDHVNVAGTPAMDPRHKRSSKATPSARSWVARGAHTEVNDGCLQITPDGKQSPFIAFSSLHVTGPAVASFQLRSTKGGKLSIAWRSEGQKDFLAEQITHHELAGAEEFQSISLPIPAQGTTIHIRLLLPEGRSDLRSLAIKDSNGKEVKKWTFQTQPE